MRIVKIRTYGEIVNISMPDIKSINDRREQSKRITKYRYFFEKLIKGK